MLRTGLVGAPNTQCSSCVAEGLFSSVCQLNFVHVSDLSAATERVMLQQAMMECARKAFEPAAPQSTGSRAHSAPNSQSAGGGANVGRLCFNAGSGTHPVPSSTVILELELSSSAESGGEDDVLDQLPCAASTERADERQLLTARSDSLSSVELHFE